MNRRTLITILTIAVAIGIGARAFSFVAVRNIEGSEQEGYSKLQLATQWVDGPRAYPDPNFGPLHAVLIVAAWRLTGDIVIGNRAFSVLFALATFAPLFVFVRRTRGKTDALAACAIYALCAPLLVVGVVTLSEGPYLFFFALSLAFCAVAIDAERDGRAVRFAIGLGVAFSAAAALRFEGWMFLPVWPAYLAWRRGWKPALAAGAVLAIFPLAHIVMSARIAGSPFAFLSAAQSAAFVNAGDVPLVQRALGWPGTFVAILGWPLAFVALAGLVNDLVRGRSRLAAGLFLWHFAVVETQALRAAMAPELARYASLMVLLLIPPTAGLVTDVVRYLIRTPVARAVAAAGVGLAISAASLPYLFGIAQAAAAARPAFVASEALRYAMDPADRVLITTDNHGFMVVESRGDYRQYRYADYLPEGPATPESVDRIVREWAPTLILLSENDPTLAAALGVSDCAETEINGHTFRPILDEPPWCLLARSRE
ncbi:glycosyltransferase family 39 protein [bacterium]|nr:glycosyltransferase family 39 protein [bacterium]